MPAKLSTLLELVGLGALVAAGFVVSVGVGLAVLGVSCLAVGVAGEVRR